MLHKIASRYWLILALIFITPLIFNLISIHRTYGLHQYYEVSGSQFNLWTDLSEPFLLVSIPLIAFSVFALAFSIRMHTRDDIRPWHILTVFFFILLSAFISGVGNMMVDIQWSSTLRDGVGGMSMSRYVYRNSVLAFAFTMGLLAYGNLRIRSEILAGK